MEKNNNYRIKDNSTNILYTLITMSMYAESMLRDLVQVFCNLTYLMLHLCNNNHDKKCIIYKVWKWNYVEINRLKLILANV